MAQELEADLLILDDEITPSQQRNLESVTGLRVVDRTALILDILPSGLDPVQASCR